MFQSLFFELACALNDDMALPTHVEAHVVNFEVVDIPGMFVVEASDDLQHDDIPIYTMLGKPSAVAKAEPAPKLPFGLKMPEKEDGYHASEQLSQKQLSQKMEMKNFDISRFRDAGPCALSRAWLAPRGRIFSPNGWDRIGV